jgi:hypothetical protein
LKTGFGLTKIDEFSFLREELIEVVSFFVKQLKVLVIRIEVDGELCEIRFKQLFSDFFFSVIFIFVEMVFLLKIRALVAFTALRSSVVLLFGRSSIKVQLHI